MSAQVSRLVAEVSSLDLEGLREFWRGRYGAPPPLRSVALLRLQLAWRLQAEVNGGLDAETRRLLSRSGPTQAEGRQLGVGAILQRNWKGRRIEVVVEESGFRYEDRVYASLSAAACAIAGSRWNGPRFFGLRDQA